jgi:hypothetical protein
VEDVLPDLDVPMLSIKLDAGIQTPKWMSTNEEFTSHFSAISLTEKECNVSGSQVNKVPKVSCSSQTDAEERKNSGGLPFLDFCDKQFHAFTGVSKNMLQFFLCRIGNKLSDSPRSLSREMKLTLVLVKLKSNMTFISLAGLFNISEFNIKPIFVEALNLLYNVSKQLVIWYD